MSIKIRQYTSQPGYTEDFNKVCDFLIRINQDKVVTPHYLWARWVWQFGPYMSMENLSRIGIFEDDGIIVGLATYTGQLGGEVIFCLDEKYSYLKTKLIDYAMKSLSLHGEVKLLLPDGDLTFQQAAIQKGFRPTTHRCSSAIIDIDSHPYALPDGYKIIGFDNEDFDVDRYYNAIWRGFNNQRPRNKLEIESMNNREGFDAPHLNLNLSILVVAPNGDYAAHCGMWCLPGSSYAYVEPVFTLPEYRRLGLGKAAVFEGINRCAALGAKHAYVLSSQQFYYSIGFYPIQNETIWTVAKK